MSTMVDIHYGLTTQQSDQYYFCATNKVTPKFPQKLWMVVNTHVDQSCTWSEDGRAVIIDKKLFKEKYMRKTGGLFKTDNFNSFIRQLNLYGFRKVIKKFQKLECFLNHKLVYQHNHFLKGREDLLSMVQRKLPKEMLPSYSSVKAKKLKRKFAKNKSFDDYYPGGNSSASTSGIGTVNDLEDYRPRSTLLFFGEEDEDNRNEILDESDVVTNSGVSSGFYEENCDAYDPKCGSDLANHRVKSNKMQGYDPLVSGYEYLIRNGFDFSDDGVSIAAGQELKLEDFDDRYLLTPNYANENDQYINLTEQ